MTLSFPNPSRSFDQTRHAVRFTGHDGLFEVPFYVEANALSKNALANSGQPSEAEYLKAFDTARSSIHDAARQIYSSGRRNFYVLTASHLR